MVQSDRPQLTVWLMRIACLILKATNTYSEFVILFSMLRYMDIDRLVTFEFSHIQNQVCVYLKR
jgi:hypothetical protein